jgi:hypothetical protein
MLVSTWALFSIVNGELGVFNSHKLTHVKLAYTPRDQKRRFKHKVAGDVKTYLNHYPANVENWASS